MTIFRGHFPSKAAIPRDDPDLLHLERPLERVPGDQSPHMASNPDAEMFRMGASTAELPSTGGKETSLFRKVTTRKHRTAWDGLSSRVRRSLSHRLPLPSTRRRANCTPDLVSEQGYDSDAHCISTPSLSDRNQSTSSMKKETVVNDGIEVPGLGVNMLDPATIVDTPSSKKKPNTDPLASPLVVLKRRDAKTPSPRSPRLSFETAYLRWKRSDLKKDHSWQSPRKDAITHESKFTEMFGVEAAGSSMLAQDSQAPTELRRVSVGWMSEGRRLGYGYSFVENDENDGPESDKAGKNRAAFGASCETESPSPNPAGKDKEPDRHNHHRPVTPISLWSRFPAYTREERNASASFEDGVIARDFCTNAAPERRASTSSSNGNGYQHGKWRLMGFRRTARGPVPWTSSATRRTTEPD